MSNLFFATLGQRPEAITTAYDRLCERYIFDQMIVLTTDRRESGIADAAATLDQVCQRDYPKLRFRWHDLTDQAGAPLIDILDSGSAMNYYRAVYSALATWKQDRFTIHFLISGGRKAMSVYATLAAALVFGAEDRLWTVLSSDAVLKLGGFHPPPGLRDQIQVVELPLLPARVIPGSLDVAALEMTTLTQQREQTREHFLALLTKNERVVAELLNQQRYASNQQLGAMLHKSHRTVETQLQAIYTKLASYVDFGDQIQDKRQALIAFLREDL